MTTTAANQPTQLRRLLVYAHFDADNIIRDYVLHALRAMRTQCAEIRFITTSNLPLSEVDKIRPYVQEIEQIENIGLDFFMWKTSLQHVALSDYDELVLMNSSVYGPLYDISRVFRKMDEARCDWWGITENWELESHVQSYFLVFRKEVLNSEAFARFWDAVLPYRHKKQIIRSYELGLNYWLSDHGFMSAVFSPWEDLVVHLQQLLMKAAEEKEKNKGRFHHLKRSVRERFRALRGKKTEPPVPPFIPPINPTLAYPVELLEKGVPFLKLETTRANPYEADLEAVTSHLHRLNYPLAYLLKP